MYKIDEYGNERIGGIIAHLFDEVVLVQGEKKVKYLDYEVGEEVEVTGEKIKNQLYLKKYKGFDYIKSYINARKYYCRTNFFFGIVIGRITVFFVNISGLKKYLRYNSLKNKDEVYESLEKLEEDLVINQFVKLNNFYIYPNIPNNIYVTNLEYYLIEKEVYGEVKKVVDRERKELKELEKIIDYYLKNIDWILLHSDYKIKEFGREQYEKLKGLYFSSDVDKGQLINEFWNFKRYLYRELNKKIKVVEKKFYKNLESKVFLENIYID